MNVKIDTKERFTVITPEELRLSANMTEELKELLLPYLKKEIPHVILDLNMVKAVDGEMAGNIAAIQQEFYLNNCSFVICRMQDEIKKIFEEKDLAESMNITPTESEAWDMVQMEEVERELFRE